MSVVILGRTYGDAKAARAAHAAAIPELADARPASTCAFRVLPGQRMTKVFVAPRTRETSRSVNYRHAVLLLARDLQKTPGADHTVYQLGEDGSVAPVDLDDLESDPLG